MSTYPSIPAEPSDLLSILLGLTKVSNINTNAAESTHACLLHDKSMHLSAICTWSDLWQLKLSPSYKCNVLHICPASVNASKSCCSHNYFGQTTLPSVNSCTDLGVSYNNRLRFTPHIDLMVARASLRAKLILRCFQTRGMVWYSRV